jgi:hypothetical protein
MIPRVFGFLVFTILACAQTPIVVELFTSEGCSSCPAADFVLTELDSKQPVNGVRIITLGEHIDYWNDLGWKDPFSSPLFSARQQEYGRAMQMQNVYTPQMVIAGQKEVLGSDQMSVISAVRIAARLPQATVHVALGGQAIVHFDVANVPHNIESVDMLLAITENSGEHVIRGGENDGHRLRHTSVVTSLTKLGALDLRKNASYAADARLNIKPEQVRNGARVVLFVQDRKTRRIVGSAQLGL